MDLRRRKQKEVLISLDPPFFDAFNNGHYGMVIVFIHRIGRGSVLAANVNVDVAKLSEQNKDLIAARVCLLCHIDSNC